MHAITFLLHSWIYFSSIPGSCSSVIENISLKHFLIGALIVSFEVIFQSWATVFCYLKKKHGPHTPCLIILTKIMWEISDVWACHKHTHSELVFLIQSIYFCGLCKNKPFVVGLQFIISHCQISAWTHSWHISLPDWHILKYLVISLSVQCSAVQSSSSNWVLPHLHPEQNLWPVGKNKRSSTLFFFFITALLHNKGLFPPKIMI